MANTSSDESLAASLAQSSTMGARQIRDLYNRQKPITKFARVDGLLEEIQVEAVPVSKTKKASCQLPDSPRHATVMTIKQVQSQTTKTRLRIRTTEGTIIDDNRYDKHI